METLAVNLAVQRDRPGAPGESTHWEEEEPTGSQWQKSPSLVTPYASRLLSVLHYISSHINIEERHFSPL